MSQLTKFRQKALLTQAELAKKADVAVGTLRSAEAGETISIPSKRKILDALGIPHERHEEVFGRILLEGDAA